MPAVLLIISTKEHKDDVIKGAAARASCTEAKGSQCEWFNYNRYRKLWPNMEHGLRSTDSKGTGNNDQIRKAEHEKCCKSEEYGKNL